MAKKGVVMSRIKPRLMAEFSASSSPLMFIRNMIKSRSAIEAKMLYTILTRLFRNVLDIKK